ncbi:MAG TPA: DUF2977 domain-containing protein [Staphylococcus saprophyticus]|nr:DUF2977 domain-containing protein [Staphylococcus saprophyticus]
MQVLVNENNLIISYATVGGFENGIEINDSILPDTFVAEFKSCKFKYEDGVVSYNRLFSDNEEAVQLKSVNESLEEKIKALEQKVAELEELVNVIQTPEIPEENTETPS